MIEILQALPLGGYVAIWSLATFWWNVEMAAREDRPLTTMAAYRFSISAALFGMAGTLCMLKVASLPTGQSFSVLTAVVVVAATFAGRKVGRMFRKTQESEEE